MKKFGTKHLTLAIFAGLALGAGFGFLLAGPAAPAMPLVSLISTIYMNALRMMVYPLVFCSLVCGIQGIGSVSRTGKIGLQTLCYYVLTTLIASLIGLFVPKMLGLGTGVSIQMMESDVTPVAFTGVLDTVANMIPANPFASFANGDMLQILVFALIVGITCLSLKEKAEPFVKVVDAVNEIAMKIISVVMYFTPVGVFCSISVVVASNGLETIKAIGGVLLAVYIAYILYALIVYGGIVSLLGHCSVGKFFGRTLPAAMNAFATCSSSATLPISKACADDLEIPNEISSMALPLGATINMDAVSIVMSFMIVFFANATGVEISFGMLVVVLLANTLLSIGTPGVPGGAIASFAALASIAGIPSGVMGVYISVNTLCDMGATCCNVLGDLACCTAMKRTCRIDESTEEATSLQTVSEEA